jgi:phage gp36-like protein
MYSTLADLKELIPEISLLQLADDEVLGLFQVSPPNAAYKRVLTAIGDADMVIDSYLRGRYELPLTSTPAEINRISAQLAVCNLFARKHEHALPEGLVQRRKDNIEWLKNIQKGIAVLDVAAAVKELPASGMAVDRTEDDRMFPDSLLSRM